MDGLDFFSSKKQTKFVAFGRFFSKVLTIIQPYGLDLIFQRGRQLSERSDYCHLWGEEGVGRLLINIMKHNKQQQQQQQQQPPADSRTGDQVSIYNRNLLLIQFVKYKLLI